MTSYHNNGGQPWQHQQQNQNEAQHPKMVTASLPTNPIASPVLSKQSYVLDENQIVMDYKPPGNTLAPFHENLCNTNRNDNNPIANKKVQWVYNPLDGSVLMDHNGAPLSVDRLLATKPLKHELSTRPGPGNKKLTYISGDDVSRTLNDVFGFDGWDLDIKDVSRVDASKDPKTGKHTIVYTARVRLTHKASGTYKEDCGAGDSTDRVYGTAIAHALKASITDAMKRAARHFGDKLGNSLYSGNFSINKAPVSLKDALDKYDIHRCNTKFGFQRPNAPKATSDTAKMAKTSASSTSASFNHPSMPPPTLSTQPPQSKAYQTQQQNQRGASLYNSSAKNEKTVPTQQHQNHRQPQQHMRQQQEGNNTSNLHSSTNRGSSNLSRQNQQHHACNTKSHSINPSGSSNNYEQNQKQSTNSGIPSTNRTPPQPQNGVNEGLNPAGISVSTCTRPTSSYGKRPTLGSMNANHSGSSSGDIASSHMGQSFNPNGNNHQNGRRVSMEQDNVQQQHQRQTSSTHTSHSNMTSVNNNAHMVSQAPLVHGSSNNYSNQQHKRPPLGAIAHNPTVNVFSSEPSSKRPKQHRHHNPYNHSISGRKSI